MSVSSEVTRIATDRDAIRNVLLAWGLAQATDNLDDLADVLAAVVNRGAVDVELDEGETYTVPAGYHNGSGSVTNGIRAGRLEPSVYDYNSGYVSNGSQSIRKPGSCDRIGRCNGRHPDLLLCEVQGKGRQAQRQSRHPV